MPLVRAPAELGRLRALAEEAVDRPGVDELARLFRDLGDLGVALGNVDDLDPEPLGECGPAGAVGRWLDRWVGIARDIEERLFDEMRDEAGIGAMGQNRRRPMRGALAQRQRALAQRVIRARRRRQVRIGIAAGPGLDAGVEIERAFFLAKLDQRDARHVDRDVEQKVAAAEPGVEHGPVIIAGQRVLNKADAVFGRDLATARLGGDDHDLVRPHVDVAHQQGQDALADTAEADDDEAAGKRDVLLAGHRQSAARAGAVQWREKPGTKGFGSNPATTKRPTKRAGGGPAPVELKPWPFRSYPNPRRIY